jgi:hypothetical protein
MDLWTIAAYLLVVPAATFLLIATIVSAVRMSQQEARSLWLFGFIMMPMAWVGSWLRDQPWLEHAWLGTLLHGVCDIIGGAAGMVVIYALMVAVVRAGRRVVGLAR